MDNLILLIVVLFGIACISLLLAAFVVIALTPADVLWETTREAIKSIYQIFKGER